MQSWTQIKTRNVYLFMYFDKYINLVFHSLCFKQYVIECFLQQATIRPVEKDNRTYILLLDSKKANQFNSNKITENK